MMRCAVGSLAALLVLAGCQDYLFEQKCPAAVSEANITVQTVEPQPVDILFVIDNSGSMQDEQENLARNFDAFVDVIAGSTLDYRMAVVTTDLGRATIDLDGLETAGFTQSVVDEASPLKTVQTRDESGCMAVPGVRHGCFRPMRGQQWVDSTRDSPETIQAAFSETALVGICGSGNERGTEAMLTALSMAGGGCNNGFLREEANLVVIFVTDEPDVDGDATANIIARLDGIKPLEKVRLALIGPVVDGEASRCRTGPDGGALATCGSLCEMDRPDRVEMGSCTRTEDCPNFFSCDRGTCVNLAHVVWEETQSGYGCDSCSLFAVEDCCSADAPATNYVELLKAFEAEVTSRVPELGVSGCRGGAEGRPACLVDSICQREFAQTLQQIARDLVVVTAFELDPPATYPEGVVVRISGGRYASAPRDLAYGTDFTIATDGTGRQMLNLNAADLLPRDDENLEIFFAVESDVLAPQVGACSTSTRSN